MQPPYYKILILDEWVQYTADDGITGFIMKSALDYPDKNNVITDMTGYVLADPNLFVVQHLTKDINHVNAIEADPNYEVLSSEEITNVL